MNSASEFEAMKGQLQTMLDNLDNFREYMLAEVKAEIQAEVREDIVEEIRSELADAVTSAEAEDAPEAGTEEAWGKNDLAGLQAFQAFYDLNY